MNESMKRNSTAINSTRFIFGSWMKRKIAQRDAPSILAA